MIKTISKLFYIITVAVVVMVIFLYSYVNNKYFHVNERLSADVNYKANIDEEDYNKIMISLKEGADAIGVEFSQTRILTSLKNSDEEEIVCIYAKFLLCAIKSREPAKCNNPQKKLHRFFLEKTKAHASKMECT